MQAAFSQGILAKLAGFFEESQVTLEVSVGAGLVYFSWVWGGSG